MTVMRDEVVGLGDRPAHQPSAQGDGDPGYRCGACGAEIHGAPAYVHEQIPMCSQACASAGDDAGFPQHETIGDM